MSIMHGKWLSPKVDLLLWGVEHGFMGHMETVAGNPIAQFEGIQPKGPYLPWLSMAGRTLLAGYHQLLFNSLVPQILVNTPTNIDLLSIGPYGHSQWNLIQYTNIFIPEHTVEHVPRKWSTFHPGLNVLSKLNVISVYVIFVLYILMNSCAELQNMLRLVPRERNHCHFQHKQTREMDAWNEHQGKSKVWQNGLLPIIWLM